MQVETVRSRPLTLTETFLVAPTRHRLITSERIAALHTMSRERIAPGDTPAKRGKDNR